MNEAYAKALTEVDEVLNYLEMELLEKIPGTFRDFIKKSKDKTYKYQYNTERTLNEQKLSKEAKAIISLIYRNYICDSEEKNRLMQMDKKEIAQLKQEKIKLNNEFEEVKSAETIQKKVEPESRAIAIIEEKGLWKKIINKIKNILKGRKINYEK